MPYEVRRSAAIWRHPQTLHPQDQVPKVVRSKEEYTLSDVVVVGTTVVDKSIGGVIKGGAPMKETQ